MTALLRSNNYLINVVIARKKRRLRYTSEDIINSMQTKRDRSKLYMCSSPTAIKELILV